MSGYSLTPPPEFSDGPADCICTIMRRACPVHRLARPTNSDPLLATWRVGRSVGRTIYACVWPSDVLIGVMDTPGLAIEAVDSHNARLAKDAGE